MIEKWVKTKEVLDSKINSLAREFEDDSIPYKIRKTELLRGVDLPIPDTNYFNKEDLEVLEKIALRKIEKDPRVSLVIRVACIPDRLSMPFFYINNREDIENVLREIKILKGKESTVVKFILQEATPEHDAQNKISGRLLLIGDNSSTLELVLEIYKGSRSTSILNRTESSDQDFLRFEKKLGEFLKPIGSIDYKNTSITENEIRSIYNLLGQYEDKIKIVRRIFSLIGNGDNRDICIEFSYRNGEITFIDID